MATDHTSSSYDLPRLVSHFSLQGRASHITPYGTGHIHDTFRVQNADPACPDYLLQRVNHQVFKNVPGLMENIEQVTAHLRQKLKDVPGADPDKEVLTLVPTHEEQSYYQDEAGNYWRMYLFLTDTRTYDLVQTKQQAYEGGKAFGRFQALLADLDATGINETIPAFHDIESRFRLFREAMAHNPKGRAQDVFSEIAFALEREEAMGTIIRMGREGKLPLRITHNDTKFNNVLLDAHDRAQCIIDLDTVMPGYVAYDYGDAIRSIVNTAPEDEKDLRKISVDLNLFEGFTQGFLEETADFLTEHEIRSLVQGALLLPFIMGLRFLTDYIAGDVYYKIHFAEHNIQRSRAQFMLVKRLEEQFALLEDRIQELARAGKKAAMQQVSNQNFQLSKRLR